LRIFLGIAGIALAVAAFFARHDGGVGLARLFTAGGFGLLHVMFGGGLLMFSSFSFPTTPWQYQSPDGFALTLPSTQWEYAPAQGDSRPAFVCRRPHMQAIVQSVSRQQTEADFKQFAAEARDKMEQLTHDRSAARFLEGVNAAGNSYSYCAGVERAADGKTVFVAHSVVWCPSRKMVVSVLFEGVPRMLSNAGKAAETSAFNAAAEKICLSVE
jgi:hypothetical protein